MFDRGSIIFITSKTDSRVIWITIDIEIQLTGGGLQVYRGSNLEALIGMKKPRAELVQQTNIAHGHQQVNNFSEKENPPNELLEKTDGERLDTGTASEAIRGDQDVEAVEQQHRAKNKRRQS